MYCSKTISDFVFKNKAILSIFSIGFGVRLYFAHLDSFLHDWDEKFHALVARNMMDDPWVPLLRKTPLIPYEVNSWCCNSIWLHKQPLFMWQMALSMKLFGVSEYTIRYPSVLMGSIMIVLTYRIATLLTHSKSISIIAALFFCFSHYQLDLISGVRGMEHNDVAFSFYILLSIWAYCEYIVSKKRYWVLLIGIFSGLAILNKWLVGLLIFLPWGISVLTEMITTQKVSKCKDVCTALICCIVVFLPWQVYILSQYYDIAMYEYRFNAKHIWEVLEGHGGDMLYYIERFPEYFGEVVFVTLYLGLILSLWQQNLHKKITHTLAICFISVLFFFSIIAQSKLTSYIFIVAPIGMIYMAIGFHFLSKYIPYKSLRYALLCICILLVFNPYQSYSERKNNKKRDRKIHNTAIFKNLNKMIPANIEMIMNVNSCEDIEVMFYQNNKVAYHWAVDTIYLPRLKANKVKIAAFKKHGEYTLDSIYYSYPYLYVIDTALK